GTADPLYRKSIRVSAGAVVALPFARLPEWPRDLVRLREAGYTILALTPRAEAVPIGAHPRPRRVALLLRTDGPGLSAQAPAVARAALHVAIPMAPEMAWLNVATAGAVALHWLSGGA